ncbi:MAG: UTRA domain-containing protein [Clostridium celatum]|nr:UTRA domain-containing protein [Clostridium celatum]
MAQVKFKSIYEKLRKDIKNDVYKDSMMLPTEMELIKEFSCSRNTVRRAIDELSREGLVKSVKGKGVIILENRNSIEFSISSLSGLKEQSIRDNKTFTTSVAHFSKILINEELSEKTSLKEGTEAYHLHRIRYVGNEAMILDINYFDIDVVKDLTVEIAQDSIYEYIESKLNTKILTSRKVIVVEKATELDKRFLDLASYDCVAVIRNYVYIHSGKLFEYTESRHRPDKFIFVESDSKRYKGNI